LNKSTLAGCTNRDKIGIVFDLKAVYYQRDFAVLFKQNRVKRKSFLALAKANLI